MKHLLFFLSLFCCSCSEQKNEMAWHGHAMTIPYHIHVGTLPKKLSYNQVYTIIEKTFQEIDETFNKYNPNSELSRLNQWKEDLPFHCSSKLFFLLQQCDLFYKLSGGRFDPTISPLKEALSKNSTPSKEALPPIGWKNLSLSDDGSVRKSNERISLDLGAIAKGYAVDLLIETLFDIGIKDLYVEWGGEIRTKGTHPEDRPWKIGIVSPNDDSPHIIELEEAALATSGDYLQTWTLFKEGKEQTFSHFFDPEKQAPYPGSAQKSITVKHESCLVADALATIFCMLEPDEDPNLFLQENVLPLFPTARIIFPNNYPSTSGSRKTELTHI